MSLFFLLKNLSSLSLSQPIPEKKERKKKKKNLVPSLTTHLPDLGVKVLPPRVLLFLEHLADILDDKLPLDQVDLREEPKPLGAGALALERRALLAREALVAAVLVVARARGAVARDALEVERPVDAGLAAAADDDAAGGRRRSCGVGGCIRRQRRAGAEHDVVLVQLLGVAVDVDVLGDELPDRRAALGRGRRRGAAAAAAACSSGLARSGLFRGLASVVAIVADAEGPILEDEALPGSCKVGGGLKGAVPGLFVEREGGGVVFFFLFGLGLFFLLIVLMKEGREREREERETSAAFRQKDASSSTCFLFFFSHGVATLPPAPRGFDAATEHTFPDEWTAKKVKRRDAIDVKNEKKKSLSLTSLPSSSSSTSLSVFSCGASHDA